MNWYCCLPHRSHYQTSAQLCHGKKASAETEIKVNEVILSVGSCCMSDSNYRILRKWHSEVLTTASILGIPFKSI